MNFEKKNDKINKWTIASVKEVFSVTIKDMGTKMSKMQL